MSRKINALLNLSAKMSDLDNFLAGVTSPCLVKGDVDGCGGWLI